MASIIKEAGVDVNGRKMQIGDIFVEVERAYIIVGETDMSFYIADDNWFLSNLDNGNIKTLKDVRRYAWRTSKRRSFRLAVIEPDQIIEPGRTDLMKMRTKILELYG